MKMFVSHRKVAFLLFMVLSVLPLHVLAGPAGKGIRGNWQVEIDFNGRKIPSILSFSRDKEDGLTGSWISLWGLSELKDVNYEDGYLSFTQVYRFGENESEAKFNGTIERRKLTGTLSGDRGESKVEGARLRPMSRAAGSWDLKIKVDEREFPVTLIR